MDIRDYNLRQHQMMLRFAPDREVFLGAEHPRKSLGNSFDPVALSKHRKVQTKGWEKHSSPRLPQTRSFCKWIAFLFDSFFESNRKQSIFDLWKLGFCERPGHPTLRKGLTIFQRFLCRSSGRVGGCNFSLFANFECFQSSTAGHWRCPNDSKTNESNLFGGFEFLQNPWSLWFFGWDEKEFPPSSNRGNLLMQPDRPRQPNNPSNRCRCQLFFLRCVASELQPQSWNWLILKSTDNLAKVDLWQTTGWNAWFVWKEFEFSNVCQGCQAPTIHQRKVDCWCRFEWIDCPIQGKLDQAPVLIVCWPQSFSPNFWLVCPEPEAVRASKFFFVAFLWFHGRLRRLVFRNIAKLSQTAKNRKFDWSILLEEALESFQNSKSGQRKVGKLLKILERNRGTKMKRAKWWHDRRIAKKQYNLGDWVLCNHPKLRKGLSRGLAPRYYGPFEVIGKYDNNCDYLIKRINSPKARAKQIHQNNLKIYFKRGHPLD